MILAVFCLCSTAFICSACFNTLWRSRRQCTGVPYKCVVRQWYIQSAVFVSKCSSLFPLSLVLNFIRTEQHNQFISVEFATYCFSAVGQCFRASSTFVERNKDITTFTCSIISFSVVITVTLSILTCCCCFCTSLSCASSLLLALAFQLLLLACLLQ